MLANGNHHGMGVEKPAEAMETWRSVPGYEGLYEVSDQGRVPSLNRLDYRGHRLLGKVLRPGNRHNGYLAVRLFREGKGNSYQVHRLVAFAFLSRLSEDLEVNHRNGDKADNRVTNLEWVTGPENMRHADEILKRSGGRKPKPVVGISVDGTVTIRFASASEAGRHGFMLSAISLCCHEQWRTCKGYRWHYADDEA